MRKICEIWVFVIFCLVLLTLKAYCMENNEIGMVLNVKGAAQVFRSDKVKKAVECQLLYVGDKIVTSNSEVEISFGDSPANSKIFLIKNNSKVKLQKKNIEVVSGNIVEVKMTNYTSTTNQNPTGDVTGRIELRAPLSLEELKVENQQKNIECKTTKPSFNWKPLSGRVVYHFKLFNNNDGNTIYETDTNSFFLSYPDNIKGLSQGEKYGWTVSVKDEKGKETNIVDGHLTILSEVDLKEVEAYEKEVSDIIKSDPSSCTPYLILAGYYEERLLLFDLIDTYKKLTELRPDNQEFKDRLEFYGKIAGLN